MAGSLSGSVEAINSSLSAVCLFEFFANLYYSLMARWPCTGRSEWALLCYFFFSLRHRTSCFRFLSRDEKVRVSVGPPSSNLCFKEWKFLVFYCGTFTKDCCRTVFREEQQKERIISASRENSEEVHKCLWLLGTNVFSLIHLLSELRTLQLITPLTIFYFSQYQKAHRSWVEEKMLCLIITRGQVFDVGTVKFVIC